MIQTIKMSTRYKVQPSKLLNIEWDYLAYIIDEFCLVLEDKLTDKKGNVDWRKYKYSTTIQQKIKGNEEFMQHIMKNQRGPNVTKK